MILKRQEHFCSSHRLFNSNWSDAKNLSVFGKCSHINGHGHNYKLEVAVCGKINEETGLVFDLTTLKEIILAEVLNDVDHKHLNFDVPWLAGKIPTTEVLVEEIWKRLQKTITDHSGNLHSVTIWETEKNSATKIHHCPVKVSP